MKIGDKIKAKPGTTTDIFAMGRIGVIKGLPPISNNYLVQWGDDIILMGFRPENITIIDNISSKR